MPKKSGRAGSESAAIHGSRRRSGNADNGSASRRRALLHQGFECGAQRGGPCFAEELRGAAVSPHLALVKNDHPRAVTSLVDQMGSPKRRQPFVATELADMIEQKLPARNIEPDGRLVEQQEPGAVQQGACDLDAPPLAAAQQADFAPAPLV